ncbi:hypothetical protein OPT61_g3464 [Boeremia exigua]|uniref:Uncharacterized protein n=1 Tax=Boeremia exigua TaxID=749465 RepID=A0ACC2IHP8_9PLEO|nr:hypothetical protein OPT61_g3464 [Boeremia exigua]
MFTRSDILRRHETTHAVAAQVNTTRRSSARACTECAKSRERCSKSYPCQRCTNKGFRCAYPQPRVTRRLQGCPPARDPSADVFEAAQYHALNDNVAPSSDPVRIAYHSQRAIATMSGADDPFRHISPSGMAEYSQVQALQATTDLPMNWLPPDDCLAIDYDSILGLGIGSLDFFSLPDSTAVPAAIQNLRQEPVIGSGPQRHYHDTTTSQRSTDHVIGDSETLWNDTSPGTIDSCVSIESSHSMARPLSPCDVPGILYATSIDGARKACTVRARKASRPLPGAQSIRPLNHIQTHSRDEQYGLEFPDVGHIAIDDAIDTAIENGPSTTLSLSSTIYNSITKAFGRLCLDDRSNFPNYKSSRFPELSSLNLCVKFYFLNFDPIMPLLHRAVTWIDDHWLLALAVAAIGCQYVEADEYAQMVEPMQEFLRRAFVVEFSAETVGAVDRSKHGLAFAQAMVLGQVGMLYAGSTELLHFAKAQRSAMIELVRKLQFPLESSQFTEWSTQYSSHDDVRVSSWELAVVNECRRRLIYSIFLLDCMGVYHFQQHSVVESNFLSVPLPNDQLWRVNSAVDWTSYLASMTDMPCLSSAVGSLFREKRVMPELGQYSRVILLHGVYREIFQLKECFARPLSNWIPSIQQAAADSNASPINPLSLDSGGRGLLTSWRNAALDCVDVLHWAANGTIALQAGAEHPTVLHLHLSRTILLAPLDKFQALADAVVSLTQSTSLAQALHPTNRQIVVQAEKDILVWAQRDACHARLAVLHSGCLFWHIRRYSCRAFYEPMAVVLATLTIWAYSSYASRTAGSIEDPHGKSDYSNGSEGDCQPPVEATGDSRDTENPQDLIDNEDIEPAPTFVHLDRPNDDEMVQAFVRFGRTTAMRANIAGVGDIHSAKGPARILREGRKILTKVSTAWGRTARLIHVLETLEEISSGRITLESVQG